MRVFSLLFFISLFLFACSKTTETADIYQIEAVEFHIQEVKSEPLPSGVRKTWKASYKGKKGESNFYIQLAVAKPKAKDLDYTIVPGSIIRDHESNSKPVIDALAKVLGAESVPEQPKVDAIPITAAVFKKNDSFDYLDNFSETLTGKVFLSKEGAEFLISLDPQKGKGQIVAVDPEYGNKVLEVLSQAL